MKEYIEKQHQAILEEECKVERSPNILDGRIHALIYFLTPSLSTDPKKKALKELDLVLMKTLAARVNIIPVIGKSDVFTKSELATFKAKVTRNVLIVFQTF